MTEPLPRQPDAVAPAHLRAAFGAGWDSYHAQGWRRTISANPHEYGSPQWVAWREGYSGAEGRRIEELRAHGL